MSIVLFAIIGANLKLGAWYWICFGIFSAFRIGKAILEGDIVSTLSGKTFEVKFADGSFYLYGTAITIHHAKRMLVVGNRWDTPELLEVTE